MLGTFVNTGAIVAGTLIGVCIHRGIKEEYKETLYTALGLVSVAIGLNATLTHLPHSKYPVLFVLALAVGGVIGTAVNLDGRFKHLVDHFSKKKENSLANGLATAVLLYCIGPLSMLGPVMSALRGDNTFLFTNATLDFISSIIFASTYGIGMVVAAGVLFCWQGTFYTIAKVSSSAIPDALMAELLIIGGLMITASGLSLLRLKDCKTLNLLPALAVPLLWYWVVSLHLF